MFTVPKKALESPDDTGQSVAPSVGDVVDLGGVQAKVTAEREDSYELSVESVNGSKVQDCQEPDGDEADDSGSEDAEGKALYKASQSEDTSAGR